jgi:hypothetical protein
VSTDLPYGPVVVRGPGGSVRVGYYDDDADRYAIVYYSQPPFLTIQDYGLVKHDRLAPIDTAVLWRRRQELGDVLFVSTDAVVQGRRKTVPYKRLYVLMLELSLVESLLSDRMITARANEGDAGGRRVFISYASKDRQLATWLAVDLAKEGHAPWLDEWRIKVGESIPVKISRGLDECEYVLVLLSPASVNSGWVEREWSTKYWSEAEDGTVRVIPVLLEDCEVPALLRPKKYVDLRSDYARGLGQLLDALAL